LVFAWRIEPEFFRAVVELFPNLDDWYRFYLIEIFATTLHLITRREWKEPTKDVMFRFAD
jgi:hypothetical protein